MATPTAKRPTAIIADDHLPIHWLLNQILEPKIEIVENVFDGQTLVDSTLRLRPNLIVVDIIMPFLDGIEAVKRIQARYGGAAVVFVSTDAQQDTVERALRTGACAFVHKARAAEDLLPAALAALGGKPFVSAGTG